MSGSSHIEKLIARNRSGHPGDFLYEDSNWMRDAYVTRRLTLRQIATEASCGLRTVARWMEIHGISTDRSRIGNRRSGPDSANWTGGPKPCPDCGNTKSFSAARCMACVVLARTGEANPRWQPNDKLTYAIVHRRLYALRGAPGNYPCAHCSASADEWAYDHRDSGERRNQTGRDDGPFSIDPAHYLPMCITCHRKFDNGRRTTR